MEEALRKDLRGVVRTPETDKTDWSRIIDTTDVALKAYLSSPKTDKDIIMRAATMINALNSNQLALKENVDLPFRWGLLATNGYMPFKRMLHSSMVAILLKETLENLPGNVPQARSAIGQAWRHLISTGDWKHDTAMTPTWSSPTVKTQIQYVIDALTVIAYKQVNTVDQARRQVSMLQLLMCSPAAATFQSVAKLCRQQLASKTVRFWIEHKCDVRHGAPPKTYDDDYVCNICIVVMPLLETMDLEEAHTKYVRINYAAYGNNELARQHATRDNGILAPLVSPERLASIYSVTNSMEQLQQPIDLPTVPLPG